MTKVRLRRSVSIFSRLLSTPQILPLVILGGVAIHAIAEFAFDSPSAMVVEGLFAVAAIALLWFFVLRRLAGNTIAELARATAVVRDAPAGVVMLTAHGKVESMNPEAERLTGYSAREVSGQPFERLLPEPSRPKYRRGFEMLARVFPGPTQRYELELDTLHRSGEWIPVHLSVTPVLVGTHRTFLCFMRDLRQRKRLEETMQRYQMLSGNTREIVLFLRPDGTLLDANQAAATALGYSRDDLLARHIRELCVGEWAPAEAPDAAPPIFETVLLQESGAPLPVEVSTCSDQLLDQRVIMWVARPIVERRRRESCQSLLREVDRLILRKQPLPAILEYLTDALAALFDYPWVWIGLKRPDGSVEVAAGAGSGKPVGQDFIVRWDDSEFGMGPTGTAIRSGRLQVSDLESDPQMAPWRRPLQEMGVRASLSIPLITQGQTLGALTLNSSDRDGFDQELVELLSGLADQVAISLQAGRDQEQHEEQLAHLATHDPLTNLPNRRVLQTALHAMLAGDPAASAGALLLLDLDHFKVINDSAGHLAGDRVLSSLAGNLKRALGPGALLVRWGGDEFAVLLPETPLERATEVAEELRRCVCESTFFFKGARFEVGVSIGIAPVDGALDGESVLSLADVALYTAKGQRGHIVSLRPDDSSCQELTAAAQWAVGVRSALRDGRLVLFKQPIVELKTGNVHHHEILIRLRDESGRMSSPGDFLGPAQRFGLMPEIDLYVVQAALELLREDPDCRLFVNLSGHSFGSEALESLIREQGQATPGFHGRLCLEITESAAVGDFAQAQDWMLRLQQLGCRFAMDDFGSGFSSLGYLRALPLDYVKIDGNFVQNLHEDPVNLAFVQAISELAQAVGAHVVAEWVETEAVADRLRSLGVAYGQGHLWGTPRPAQAPVAGT